MQYYFGAGRAALQSAQDMAATHVSIVDQQQSKLNHHHHHQNTYHYHHHHHQYQFQNPQLWSSGASENMQSILQPCRPGPASIDINSNTFKSGTNDYAALQSKQGSSIDHHHHKNNTMNNNNTNNSTNADSINTINGTTNNNNTSNGNSNTAASRYESQKRRDWNTFCQYLRNHRPPLALARCSGAHVLEFLRYLDQFGKTKVHAHGCPFFGQPTPATATSVNTCACPLRQAWGSLDALIGRLRAAFQEHHGATATSNPFAARAIRLYLRDVRDIQAKARGIPYQKKKRKTQNNAISASTHSGTKLTSNANNSNTNANSSSTTDPSPTNSTSSASPPPPTSAPLTFIPNSNSNPNPNSNSNSNSLTSTTTTPSFLFNSNLYVGKPQCEGSTHKESNNHVQTSIPPSLSLPPPCSSSTLPSLFSSSDPPIPSTINFGFDRVATSHHDSPPNLAFDRISATSHHDTHPNLSFDRVNHHDQHHPNLGFDIAATPHDQSSAPPILPPPHNYAYHHHHRQQQGGVSMML